MKKILILFLFMSLIVLFGCTTNDTSNDNLNDKNNNQEQEQELLKFEGVTLSDMNVFYDGKEHTIEVKGLPDFANVTYENEGPYTEVGAYEIKAVVSADGYADLELTATLTINPAENGLTFEEYNRYIINKPFEELAYTVEMEIKLGSDITGNAGTLFGNYDLSVNGGSDVGVGRVYNIEVKDGIVYFVYTNKAHQKITVAFDNFDVRTNDWIHLTIAFDVENNQIYLYTNGVLNSTKDIDGDFSDYIKPTTFHIGGDNLTLNPAWFKGEYRELALYSDLRTVSEIMSDYQDGVNLNDENLMAQYNLSSYDIHKDLTDNSGNGYYARYEDTWYDEQEIEMDYAYSFAVVGDTQMLNRYGKDEPMNTLYQWIVNNVESQKIKHVFGLGDITDTWGKVTPEQEYEWQRAKNSIYKMNGMVSYSLVRGNHDESKFFNQYFNEDAYKNQFGGFYDDGTINTSWKTLKIGNQDFLLIGLDYGASDDELAWAGSIVEAHPNHKVIVTTHGYLEQEANRMDADYSGTPCAGSDYENDLNYNHGQGMWEKFISQYENMFLVISGHNCDEDVVYRQDLGVHGNVVTQMLVDFQDLDLQLLYVKKELGAGIVVMLYMNEDCSKLEIAAYSPIRNQYYKKYNHYTIDLEGQCKGNHKLTHHDEVKNTCTTDGNIEYSWCKDCETYFDSNGNVVLGVTTKATGHNYNEVVGENDVTYTCGTCNDSYVKALDSKIVVNHLYTDGTVASPQEVNKVFLNSIHEVNAKEIDGYVASCDYVKVHALENTNVINIYYSKVMVWDGSSISSSLKGSGTMSDPYLIENGADLAYMASVIKNHIEYTNNDNGNYTMYSVYKGLYFKLVNSIDLNRHPLMIGYYNAWSDYSVFAGTLDGNNCSIRGIDVSATTIGSGLFGGIGPSGVVKNLVVYGTVNSTTGTVGGLTGWLGGKLENCINYVNVKGTTNVGGLVGNAETGSQLLNCVNYGNVIGTESSVSIETRVGGVAGTGKSVFTHCVNFGNVTGTTYVGGVIGGGTGQDTTSLQSYLRNYGVVTGVNTTGGIVGGLHVRLDNAVNYGEVKASSWNIGGIVGFSRSTSVVSNCTNNGFISTTGSCVGGIVGTNQGVLQSCINNGMVKAPSRVGGIVYNNEKTVTGCTNNGIVECGSSLYGGICQTNNGTITNCVDNNK